jgi:hypothetical protein
MDDDDTQVYGDGRRAAQDKLEQWDMPSEAFNAWWDSDYDDSTNPYEKDTFAYWAWAAWQAAQPAQEPESECNPQDLCAGCRCKYVAQPEQEPVANVVIREGLPTLLKNREIKSTDQRLYTTPPQRTWVDLTEDELVQIGVATGLERAAVEMISNKLKEKNT